jgi:hypothetical protein
VLLHKCDLAVVHSADVLFLVLVSLVAADAVGEAKPAIVVNGVNGVGEYGFETCKVHAETMPHVSGDY